MYSHFSRFSRSSGNPEQLKYYIQKERPQASHDFPFCDFLGVNGPLFKVTGTQTSTLHPLLGKTKNPQILSALHWHLYNPSHGVEI